METMPRNTPQAPTIAPPVAEPAYGSNSIRLSTRQWLLVLAISVLFVSLAPFLWTRVEKFELEADYRMPYDLSSDYWMYDRYTNLAAPNCDTVLLGDSVVWGQYVTREQTLSHHLNDQSQGEQFANLGLDGAHPMALEGLLEHYASGISGKRILLLCNLLWMTSPKADLQSEEEVRINHPRLIPQFDPRIKCYKEDASPRLGIVVERKVPFLAWTNHIQLAHFDKGDIPSWTINHPYELPRSSVLFQLPASDNKLRHEAVSWTERGAGKQSFDFVDPKHSMQWLAFQRVVASLQRRNNQVFVVIGPLNEHMLAEPSLARYQALRTEIQQWLTQQKIPHCTPSVLPSECYADLSHPLNEGYRLLAKDILASQRAPGERNARQAAGTRSPSNVR